MKKKIGIALIVLATVFITHPFLVLPAIPLYLIGTALLWFSPAKKGLKYAFSMVPLVIAYPLMYLSMYLSPVLGMAMAQKLEFRFPSGFEGRVTVVSPVECGQPVKIVDGREVIEVPENGMVYYQGEIEDGYMNWTYVMGHGSKEPRVLDYFDTWESNGENGQNIPEDSIGVVGGGGWSASSFVPDPAVHYHLRFLWLRKWGELGGDIIDREALTTEVEGVLRTCQLEKQQVSQPVLP